MAKRPSELLLHKDFSWAAIFVILSIIVIFNLPLPIALVLSVTLLMFFVIKLDFKLALLFIIAIFPVTRVPTISQYIEPIKLGIYSLFLFAWLVTIDLSELRQFRHNPFNIFFAAFSVILLINLFVTISPEITSSHVLMHFTYFLFFYLFINVFQDTSYMKKIVYLVIISGAVMAVFAILQYMVAKYKVFSALERLVMPYSHWYRSFFESEWVFTKYSFRSVGTFFHPNILGVYLSLILPISLSLMLLEKNKVHRILYAASILVMFTGILFSKSRGAVLSIFISGAFLVLISWRHLDKRFLLFFMISCMAISFMFLKEAIYYLRLENVLSQRDIIWKNAIRIMMAEPIFGWGLGTMHLTYASWFGFPSLMDFRYIFGGLIDYASPEVLSALNAHNAYINYAAETGILAPFIIVGFYVIYLKEMIRTLRSEDILTEFEYAIVTGCMSVMMGNFVYNFFETETCFADFSIAPTFVLIAAFGASLAFNKRLKYS